MANLLELHLILVDFDFGEELLAVEWIEHSYRIKLMMDERD